MAADLVTNIGEEWLVETLPDGASVTVGLYDDSVDALGDGSTLSDITTEPTGAAYARQASTVTTQQVGSDYGFKSDSDITFDTSDSTRDVDNAFYQVNFQSDDVAGDGSAQDHMVALASLTSVRNLQKIGNVEIAAGDLEIAIT